MLQTDSQRTEIILFSLFPTNYYISIKFCEEDTLGCMVARLTS